MEVFEGSEKTEFYNYMFRSIDGIENAVVRKQMSAAFKKVRAMNRLLEDIQGTEVQRRQRAIKLAADGFVAQGIERVEKNVLIATAEMLLGNNLV